MGRRKYLLIANPNAGMMKLRTELLDIVSIYSKNDVELTIAATQKSGDAAKIVKERGNGYDCIVCSGGDGTFNELISGAMQLEEKTVLGYIPAGTTHDFAAGMHLSSDLKEAALRTIVGEDTAIDVGKFNDRYFSYVASFGAFTETSYSTPQYVKNAIGHLAYLLEGAKDLANIKPLKLTVEMNGKTKTDEYLFGAVSNSTSLGGVLKLPPDAVDMQDGLFEVVLVRNPKTAAEGQKMISALLTQKPDGDVFQMCTASQVRFYPEKLLSWSLDGEYEPGSKEILVQNIPNAIRIRK